ncbi:hypothetical protein DL93DRAFT_2174234 [Clavulina sp. PMI_390]|nr:hypothetical protein DL93DRAFT_2174234 [Clavulina sp. PMI_390]
MPSTPRSTLKPAKNNLARPKPAQPSSISEPEPSASSAAPNASLKRRLDGSGALAVSFHMHILTDDVP